MAAYTDSARARKALSKVGRLFTIKVTKGRGAGLWYGVVLEPETVDSQKDIYSALEVREAAHRFMACASRTKALEAGQGRLDLGLLDRRKRRQNREV